jgi:hypothetical protein
MPRYHNFVKTALLGLAALTVTLTLAGSAKAQPSRKEATPKEPTARTLSFLKPEMDVVEGGKKGVRFRFRIEINDAKGQPVSGRVYILDKDGNTIDAIDPNYADAQGRMCTSQEYTVEYDSTHVTFTTFLPYEAITTDPGSYTISYVMNVWHDGLERFFLKTPQRGSFDLDVR